jgi:prepilin-type N-terminal cleavage/methylation domain-containing protein
MQRDKGFTIVELLIVIVVIGVLATIAVVAYSGIRNSADSAAVQSDLRNFAQKAEEFFITNERYPSSNADLKSLGFKANIGSYQQQNDGNLLYCAVTTGPDARFVLAARTRANKAYTYSSTEGLRQYTGTWSGAHSTGCPLYGIANDAVGRTYGQGYHPPGWGSPGLKVWAGGTIDAQ